jgi:hypothetical protein
MVITNNTTNVTLDIDMRENISINTNLKDLLTGKEIMVVNGWIHNVEIPAKTGIILI